MEDACHSTQTIISAIMYRVAYKTIYKILCQVCMRVSAAIPEPNGCLLVHTDAQCCILMHTNACILTHAGETWRVRYVHDVFLEPYLAILLCCYSCKICKDFSIQLLCRNYTASKLDLYNSYTVCISLATGGGAPIVKKYRAWRTRGDDPIVKT